MTRKKIIAVALVFSTFFFNHPLDPDRESSTSLIDAAFIKLTSDNDKRTNIIKRQIARKERKSNAKKKKKEGGRNEEKSQVSRSLQE